VLKLVKLVKFVGKRPF